MNFIEKYAALSPEKQQVLLERVRERGHEYGIYPLSPEQKGAWAAYCLEQEENSYYNIQFQIRMRNNIDPQKCRDAALKIMQSQEVCRYRFAELGGDVYQYVYDEGSIDFGYVRYGSENTPQEMERIKSDFIRRPFDLVSEYPVRFLMLHESEDEAVLIVSIHHIICDGWSVGVFLEQFMRYMSGSGTDMPDPAPFSEYLYRSSAGGKRGENLRYWKERLAGKDQYADLPLSYPEGRSEEGRGRSLSTALGKELSEDVHRFIRERRTTVHAFFLAAYTVLMSRYSGREEFLIGTPLAKREDMRFSGTIGDFATTMVLPLSASGDDRFSDHLAKTQKELFDAVAHQDAALSEIYSVCDVRRREGIHPMFQTSFAVQSEKLLGTSRGQQVTSGGTTYEVSPVEDRKMENFELDICCTVYETPGDIRAELLYNEALFSSDRIKGLLGVYEALIRQIVSADDILLNDLRIENGIPGEGPEAAVDSMGRILPCGFEGRICRITDEGCEDTGWYGCIMENGGTGINEDRSDRAVTGGREISKTAVQSEIRAAYGRDDINCIFVRDSSLRDVYLITENAGDAEEPVQIPQGIAPVFDIDAGEWEDEDTRQDIIKALGIMERLSDISGITDVYLQKGNGGTPAEVIFRSEDGAPDRTVIEDVRAGAGNESIPVGLIRGGSISYYKAREKNETEQKIFDIWRDILQSEDFSVYDKFYETGGDSLKAVKLFNRLNSEFEKDINIAQLFSCNTVREQAVYFMDEQQDEENEETESIGF